MPTYEYECPTCESLHEVIKRISQLADTEVCPECSAPMIHVIVSPPGVNTSTCRFESHFNHGLGKEFTNKRQIKEELTRIKGETGKEIVEVGSDNLKSIKKKRKEYTLEGYN